MKLYHCPDKMSIAQREKSRRNCNNFRTCAATKIIYFSFDDSDVLRTPKLCLNMLSPLSTLNIRNDTVIVSPYA